MEILINENNKKIIINAFSNTINVIRKVIESENKGHSDKKKLTLLDLLARLYPNLNSINLLFIQYFTLKNLGNSLPIGLIMRCCIEDMIFAKYLLTFKDNPDIFENEIIVQSKNSISEYAQFLFEKEPEYWKCSDEQKKELTLNNIAKYNAFKLENPMFFDELGKIKSIKKLRKDISNIQDYFDSKAIGNHGPSNMFKRIKSVELEFSYIYFEYRFYCLFEHYSFHTRKVIVFNEHAFGHLALSFEFILRGIKDILQYLNVDNEYLNKINEIKNSLGKIEKNE